MAETTIVFMVGLVGVVLTQGLSLVVKIIMARRLGLDAFGVINIALMVLSLGVLVGELGLCDALTRNVAHAAGEGDARAIPVIEGAGLWLGLAGSLAIAVALWVLAAPIANRVFRDPRLAGLLAVLAWSLPAVAIADILASVQRGLGRMWVPQLLVNALRVGLFALALSLISTERVTPWLVAWLYVGTAAVPACLLLTFFFARRQQTFGTIRPAVPKLLGLGLPLLAAGLVTGPVVNQCMPLLLAAERSSTEVGLFSAAWTFQSLMFLPVWVISLPGLALWSRMIGESDAHGQVVSFDFAGRWSLALTALASLLFIAMPALMLRTVFGEAFVSAGPALQVFGWGTIIASVAGPLGVVMMARGQAARIFAIAAVSATIALLTTLLLVKRMGAMGVAIGYSTMNSVSVGLSVLSADTSVRVTLFSTTYRSFVACVALAFAATLGCARLIVRADLWGAAMTVAVFLVGLILSLGVVRPFGPVDRALAHAILGAIRRRWPA